MLEKAGVRGVFVRLGASWREIASRAEYPEALRDTLGQTVAASALLTGNIKFDGSLSLEFKSQGAVRLLFSECTDRGRLRGLARFDADALGEAVNLASMDDEMLAITVGSAERGRYQGIVDLADSANIGEALEGYFSRSEQLPTRILLAADGERAVGLMLQPVPGEGGHSAAEEDADAWERIGMLTSTLGTAEMLETLPEDLLYRLYHEETVLLYEPKSLAFGCTCSRERVEGMLRNLGREEVEATLEERNGEIEVVCEFCATKYLFDRVDAGQLLTEGDTPPVSHTLQ
ncbi:Hsp33 family molecular chaperone HslO [Luteibacter anthropi]|uniref:Hsp33 family molecular chaperone HslO n=2 Tax=Luteibacter anthropi TaxID=564369 RepID=A0A7X5UDR0_9GAMM|nr:Hsp33 family molecular chaperone HslO [Luteibacter anthropi]NII08608.1 Hsp33 family molecular chaperone HslO [Luteibacter anthropi]URX64548.1 Hsp33 family molecular chaperone HslO [Luteibacter anthropi]